MNDQLSMLPEMTSEASGNATSSPESADGRMPSHSPSGRKTETFGPAHVHASLFRSPDSKKAISTNDTCGPLFNASSPSADLQRSLESRLRDSLALDGSPEFALTWRSLDMPLGAPVCRLAPSVRRTGGSGCSGWPTPAANEYNIDPHNGPKTAWATPQSRDHKGAPGKAAQDNGGFQASLPADVAASGLTPSGSSGPTARRGALNPEFVCWLMGFPTAWVSCGVTATPSSRRSRPSS
jgi:hypothetical protein